MAFLLFLYKENVTKYTNTGGTTNFIGLSSPIMVHMTPTININADIIDKVKNLG